VVSRAPTIGATAILLLAVSVGIASFADLSSSSQAMACCAKTHNQCAGLKSPEDCCKGMGHSLAGSTVATLTALKASAVNGVGAAVPPPTAVAFGSGRSTAAAGVDFKRPHDPPHLHAFSLLI
jgi:hypothetical protein